jgi:cytochrome c2
MTSYTLLITDYLEGKMTEAEKQSFESALISNPDLKKAFENHKDILQIVSQTGIKTELKKGMKKGQLKKIIKKVSLGVIILAAVLGITTLVKSKLHTNNKNNIRYELNEENKKEWADADVYLTPQVFTINGGKDTVIETKNGIIISIPANAFLNATGDAVTSELELEIKEALNPFDIMKAGLSTTSEGKLLETGGMFYINARKDAKNLDMDKSKGLYVSIPDNHPEKSMLLFDGKRLSNGQIDWVNPIPFENKVPTVDILSLNFYPPNFLDSLKANGFDIANKRLTDSIYYSLICLAEVPSYAFYADSIYMGSLDIASGTTFSSLNVNGKTLFKQNCATCHSANTDQMLTGPGLANVINKVPNRLWLRNFILNNEKMIKSGDSYANKIYKQYGKAAMTVFEGQLSEGDVENIIDYLDNSEIKSVTNNGTSLCEIDPSRIHAIWDKKFNNTLLATHAFEERLQIIFTTCNVSLLNLYIKNLDKPFYKLDSIAMRLCDETKNYNAYHAFEKFYNKHEGFVSITQSHIALLQKYMEEKQKIYKEAAIKALTKLYSDENTAAQKSGKMDAERVAKITQNEQKAFMKELAINLKEAYRQLGKESTVSPPVPNYRSTTITNTGWKNVDRYVLESTLNRTSLDYTDPETGKKAEIKYVPFTIAVKDSSKYDRITAYVLPNQLSSFQRMEKAGNIYKINLNELMNYGAIVYGFKDNTVYMGNVPEAIAGKEETIGLTEVSEKELQAYRLNNAGASTYMLDELNHQIYLQKETIRNAKIKKREELRQMLYAVVFPCTPAPQVAAK